MASLLGLASERICLSVIEGDPQHRELAGGVHLTKPMIS